MAKGALRVCNAFAVSPDSDRGQRCLAPVPSSHKFCCETHQADFDASYTEYKAAAREAAALRIYAQLKLSNVRRLSRDAVDFHMDGIREHLDAVERELELRKVHDTRFFLVGEHRHPSVPYAPYILHTVDDGHTQRLEKLQRDLENGRALESALLARKRALEARARTRASTVGRLHVKSRPHSRAASPLPSERRSRAGRKQNRRARAKKPSQVSSPFREEHSRQRVAVEDAERRQHEAEQLDLGLWGEWIAYHTELAEAQANEGREGVQGGDKDDQSVGSGEAPPLEQHAYRDSEPEERAVPPSEGNKEFCGPVPEPPSLLVRPYNLPHTVVATAPVVDEHGADPLPAPLRERYGHIEPAYSDRRRSSGSGVPAFEIVMPVIPYVESCATPEDEADTTSGAWNPSPSVEQPEYIGQMPHESEPPAGQVSEGEHVEAIAEAGDANGLVELSGRPMREESTVETAFPAVTGPNPVTDSPVSTQKPEDGREDEGHGDGHVTDLEVPEPKLAAQGRQEREKAEQPEEAAAALTRPPHTDAGLYPGEVARGGEARAELVRHPLRRLIPGPWLRAESRVMDDFDLERQARAEGYHSSAGSSPSPEGDSKGGPVRAWMRAVGRAVIAYLLLRLPKILARNKEHV